MTSPRRYVWHLSAFCCLLSIPVLTAVSSTGGTAEEKKIQQYRAAVPVVTLQTSENAFIHTKGSISAVVASQQDDETIYLVNGQAGEVHAFNGKPTSDLRPHGYTSGPIVPESREGVVFVDRDGKVGLSVPGGQLIRMIDSLPAHSVAALSSGNIVVASPTQSYFLHLYTPAGKLVKSFGPMKNHTPGNRGRNEFLHQGKVLVDAADNIYYVYYHVPLVQKFSPDGNLVRQIQVKGRAIDIQQELADRFNATQPPDVVGGFVIIKSAAIDYKSGHLWLGLLGEANSGVVYEYDAHGEKLCEYILQTGTSADASQPILGVNDIALTASKLYVVTNYSMVVYFNRTPLSTLLGRIAPGAVYSIEPTSWTSEPRKANVTPPANPQPECGINQNWPNYSFRCNSSKCIETAREKAQQSTGITVDCKMAHESALAGPYTLLGGNFGSYAAGTYGHMRGGCSTTAITCNNGQRMISNLVLDCPEPACPRAFKPLY